MHVDIHACILVHNQLKLVSVVERRYRLVSHSSILLKHNLHIHRGLHMHVDIHACIVIHNELKLVSVVE